MAFRERVCADPAWWHEVFLLGVGKAHQGAVGAALNHERHVWEWTRSLWALGSGEDGDSVTREEA